MQRDSIGNILRVSILLCLVCSIGVSVAAVGLRELQDRNARLDRQKNVLLATGIYTPQEVAELSGDEVTAIFENNIVTHYVQVGTGKDIPISELPDGKNYDPRAASQSPDLQVRISKEASELLGFGIVAPYYAVYEIRNDEGEVDSWVLPIMGNGLWSTMYGFLALEPDLRTIRGINFYEHGETPGLGGEIENEGWKAIWEGKVAFDDQGLPVINVIKGTVSGNDPSGEHKIDGLAGATITSNGVEAAVNFWLGDEGFGKFLDRHKY